MKAINGFALRQNMTEEQKNWAPEFGKPQKISLAFFKYWDEADSSWYRVHGELFYRLERAGYQQRGDTGWYLTHRDMFAVMTGGVERLYTIDLKLWNYPSGPDLNGYTEIEFVTAEKTSEQAKQPRARKASRRKGRDGCL
jgi:hypothetical protein